MRLALLFAYCAGKYGIKLTPAYVHGTNVLSMLQCATIELTLSGFVLNTVVAKLGCP